MFHQHILKSIHQDAQFVQSVTDTLQKPVILNLRCGRWYSKPKNVTDTCYFKSTDGHYGKWDIPIRRLNLHLVPTIEQNRGIVIVDSTRRGKRFPDSLSRTVPLWCGLINALVFSSLPNLHTLPTLVSPSEQSSMVACLTNTLIPRFKKFHLHLPTLTLPLRPIFLGPHSPCITRPDVDNMSYFPVYCLTASRVVENPNDFRQNGFVYIQGAADDEENWAHGLTPELFWMHESHLLKNVETCNAFLQSLNIPQSPTLEYLSGFQCAIPQTCLVVGSRKVADPTQLPWSRFTHIINCTSERLEYPNIELESHQLLCLNLARGKSGSARLRYCFPMIESWYGKHVISAGSNEGSCSPNVLVYCDHGLDLSVVVTLMLLIRFHPEIVNVESGALIDKHIVRQGLLWLTNHYPRCLPTRAGLKQLHKYPSHYYAARRPESTHIKTKSFEELQAEIIAMPTTLSEQTHSIADQDPNSQITTKISKAQADTIAGKIVQGTRRISPGAVGLSFELRTCQVLNMYHPAIVSHVGKVGDSGIDFEGVLLPWSVHQSQQISPCVYEESLALQHPRAIPILGQCKAMSRSMSPGDLHGFAGMLATRNRELNSSTSSSNAYLGLFVVESGFSAGTWEWVMNRCTEPIALMSIRSIDALSQLNLCKKGMGAGGTKYLEINHAALRQWPWLTKRHFGAAQTLEHQFLLVEDGHKLPTRMWSNLKSSA